MGTFTGEAGCVEQGGGLGVEALLEDDHVAVRGGCVDGDGAGKSLLEGDADEEFLDHFAAEGAVGGDDVFLVDLVAGVGQFLGEVPVIGHDDEALAVVVESSHVMEVAVVWGEEVVEGESSLWIGFRAGAYRTFTLPAN